MLCYRCGSHVQDGAEKCWNCGTVLGNRKSNSNSTSELRARQRTGSRMFGVVFKIGDLIGNRYRVKDIVGSGGAGVVYRAHDQEIDVDVAVKVINQKLVQTSDEQRLFSRQTKIARKLSHQNVVRIYDEGRDEGRPYFTMQFLEGLSLRKIIDLRKEKKTSFSLSEIEPILNQLCQALDYTHKTSFHGNLKPDNVIVLPDLLKITDFSLLRGLPRKPFLAIQKSRGTNFRYLAPEVRLEVPDLDKSVDIYSLGVILAEMLTGIVYDEAKADQLSQAGANLDPGILAIVKRAVARSPRERYQSAGAIYDDVRDALMKGAGRLPSEVVSIAEPPPGDPGDEAPTQRLDINKHGERPQATPIDPPPPVAPDEVVMGDRELSQAFEIDDGMIEASQERAPAAAGAESKADPAMAAAAADEETLAVLEPEPGSPAMEEISNSSIELIADPLATNIVRLQEEQAAVQMAAVVESEKQEDTVQPHPLPDSALPGPAFAAHVGRGETRSGDLVGGNGSVTPRTPTIPVETNGTHAPTGAPSGALKAKKRPMTRPRMSAVPAAPVAAVSTVGASHLDPALSARPQTMPGMSALQPPLPPPPANNRPLYVTVGMSIAAAILAMLVVLKVTCDQQEASTRQIEALRQQIGQLNGVAANARANAEKADTEVKESGAEIAAAAKAEAEAKARADELAKQQAEAEAEAKRIAEEARKAEAAAKKSKDLVVKKHAMEAVKRRDAARDKLDKAERDAARERRKEEAERKKRERAERRKEAAERRRAQEEEAARKAEDRAAALAAKSQARREKRAEAAAEKKAEKERAAEARREAAEAKKAADERAAAEKAAKDEKAALAARTEPAPKEEPKCPRGMVLVAEGSFMLGSPRNDPERNFGDKSYTSTEVGAYCVDYYEYPNGRGSKPSTKVSYKSAASRCKRKKKRLCTEEEWEKACKGRAGTRYPYGNQWDPARCNTEDEEGEDRAVAKSGTFRKCRSGFNVFDMSGNVAEWTSSKWGSGYVVKGGAADRPGYDGRCAARKKKTSGSASEHLGFRCCADPK